MTKTKFSVLVLLVVQNIAFSLGNSRFFDRRGFSPMGFSSYNLYNLINNNAFPISDKYSESITTFADGRVSEEYYDSNEVCRIIIQKYPGDIISYVERNYDSGQSCCTYYYKNGRVMRYEIKNTKTKFIYDAVSFAKEGFEESRISTSNGNLIIRDNDGNVVEHIFQNKNDGVYWRKVYDKDTHFLVKEFGYHIDPNDKEAIFEFQYDPQTGKSLKKLTWHGDFLMGDDDLQYNI